MPNYSPPLPDPYDNSPFRPSGLQRGNWGSEPPVVRGWAYPLTWLGLIVLPFAVIGTLLGARGEPNIGGALLFVILWCVDLWLNRALKRGDPNAWNVQIVVSVLGLLGFPIGTLIHGYVLSQWFKPETRAWFGR